jgi:hypothetical protein
VIDLVWAGHRLWRWFSTRSMTLALKSVREEIRESRKDAAPLPHPNE